MNNYYAYSSIQNITRSPLQTVGQQLANIRPTYRVYNKTYILFERVILIVWEQTHIINVHIQVFCAAQD